MALMPTPKQTLEIRFHGRAGQGAKSSAQVVAEAFLDQNCFAQAFPQYGPERRGSPVTTFVRLSPKPIDLHCLIQAPDVSVVLDERLIGHIPVADGLEAGAILIVNSPKTPQKIAKKTGFDGLTITLDASDIANYFLGRNIPNIIILGALAKAIYTTWGPAGFRVTLAMMEKSVRNIFSKKWGEKVTEKNIAGMRTAFKETVLS